MTLAPSSFGARSNSAETLGRRGDWLLDLVELNGACSHPVPRAGSCCSRSSADGLGGGGSSGGAGARRARSTDWRSAHRGARLEPPVEVKRLGMLGMAPSLTYFAAMGVVLAHHRLLAVVFIALAAGLALASIVMRPRCRRRVRRYGGVERGTAQQAVGRRGSRGRFGNGHG